ncbi:MAG: hypothetical protein A2V70_09320 [Planctomycetes bacterium RBG_13_63_9]|nr:MAG: hypothetical protein A2V70_09320 [Planctomycetes bacterium RBG_13_63_9]
MDERVYVTLGSDAPLSALDAATGETIMTNDETNDALEFVYHEGTLYVVAGESAIDEEKARRRGERPGFVEVRPRRPPYPEDPPPKRVLAMDAATGRLLWKKADSQTAELMPTALAVSGRRAFFQNADALICPARCRTRTCHTCSALPVSSTTPGGIGPTGW